MGVRGGDIAAPFLRKVYAIVSNEETDDIVSWMGNGKQFTVHQLNEFSTKILPQNFNHPNFSSFVRQLNSYGFRKVEHGTWTFANPNFFQGGEDHLKKINRKTTPKKAEENAQRGWHDESGFGLGGDPRRTALDLHMRQELQICRLEVAHLVHRIGTVEHIQEQLLALLINPQGGAQRAAAQGGMQGQPGNQGQGGVGDVLESLYKQICESRHSGDAASLGGLGAYGAAAGLARQPGLGVGAKPGGLGAAQPGRQDLGGMPGGGMPGGGMPGGGMPFGYDALAGLGVTGVGGAAQGFYHQAK